MKSEEAIKNKKIKSKYKFNMSEYWFVEKFKLLEYDVLEIILVGGKYENEHKKSSNKAARRVLWDYSKQVRMRFNSPLAFQRLDESFAMEKGGTYTGERLRLYTESEYLKYFSKVSFGIAELSHAVKHYCFISSDDIISVLTTDEPEIEVIK